jgi:tripartite-type tricarboxylate transporter receptor subunit TctC
MHRRTLLGASGLLALPALRARAQAEWPDKPVTIIVPFAAGSSSDIIGRSIAQYLQQTTGKPFVVENRPGATGEVGARQVIRSAPDGATLMHAPISTWAINVALRPNLGYDPVTQLTRITQTVRTPNILVVNPQAVPVEDLPGLVAWLKRNAKTAAYPSSGVGSSDHLTGEMFKLATGTDMAHVPYSGGGPAMTSLIAGITQVSFQNLGAVIPHIRDGRLKAILTTAEARSPVLPEVPTSAEAGLPGFQQDIWIVAAAPARTPPAVVASLNAAFNAAARQIEPRLTELGLRIKSEVATPEQVDAFVRGELDRYASVLRAAGVRPE